MKPSSVCSLLLVILSVLQSLTLFLSIQAQEYSVEEQVRLVQSLVQIPMLEGNNALPSIDDHQKLQNVQRYSKLPHNRNNHQLQLQTQYQQPHSYPPDPASIRSHQSTTDQQQINSQHEPQLHESEPAQYRPTQQSQRLPINEYHPLLSSKHDDFVDRHQTLAEDMQQVLLYTSNEQYHYAHTQVEWKHETNGDGQMSEFYMNYETSSLPVATQDQLAYYQYHHLQQHRYHHHRNDLHYYQQHQVYSRFASDEHDHETHDPSTESSCESRDSSVLMQNLEEPTCKAASSLMDNPTDSRNVPNLSHLTNKQSHNSNIDSFPLSPHVHYESSLMGAIRHYWREVSGLCLMSAIFLNWLFVIIKRRFVASGLARPEHSIDSMQQTTTRSISKDTHNSSAHDSAFEETASPLSLDDVMSSESSSDRPERSTTSIELANTSSTRQRSSTLKAEPIPIPIPAGHNSLSASLSNSLNNSEYNSRYSSDFDSIQRLGRGGFGIVFEARNKIDDCHYAVKRICLPLEKEARERVMREVRALAKLDHAGIVRYYNAWLETPPDEWLKQHDAQLGIVSSIDGTSFPSTDGIYEQNESSRRPGKFAESGDNSSGLFGKNQLRRRSNGYRKFLKNNSSSPSLDIVFEGSGSIRLESENSTEKTDSFSKRGHNCMKLSEGDEGDINSDSEDSDFIQFQSRGNTSRLGDDKSSDDEFSVSSHLTEPFSSSDSELNEPVVRSIGKTIDKDERKQALTYQKEMRQFNNASLVENLHVEKVYLYIQMQLCRKDTLKDWLKTNCENRDKTIIFDLFYQIVDAVEYVHSQDLIHRDLKPSNIFFSLDGTLKIGDFGLCRAKTSAGIGSSLDLQEYVAESDAERSFEAVHTEQVGTQLYMSPEQLNGLSYNQKVDIFAMGLILLELLIPFKTQMQRVNVLFKARNNLYSDEFRQDHPKEHELVKGLLNRSPLKRPTATEIKQHELLASAQLSQPVIERIYHRRRTISSNSSTE